jgi:hypothetical protein
MSELNQDQKDLINSVKFATEFLKVVRGFKVDQERTDSLPIDIKEHLANQHLNEIIKDNNLEPEMLVWGLVHIIEVLIRYADLVPEQLTSILDTYLEFIEGNPDNNGDQ